MLYRDPAFWNAAAVASLDPGFPFFKFFGFSELILVYLRCVQVLISVFVEESVGGWCCVDLRQERLERFEPQSLANIAWTWATLRAKDPLIGAVAQHALQQMRRFRPLPLTNLLWALATLHCWPWPLEALDVLAGRVMHQLAEYNPQQLVNTF